MTGVQPYVILLDYDEEITTYEDRESYTLEYYDRNIEIDNAFLFIYFAEEDTDNDVGDMCCAVGSQAEEVMDSEALNIFWAYMNDYWYTDMSTDDMFVYVFTDTADTIMPQNSGSSVLQTVLVVLVVCGVLAAAVYFMKRKRRVRQYE